MMNLLIYNLYMYMMSLMMFTILYKYLLMSLMSLEMMMMSLLMMIYLVLLNKSFEYFLLFYLLFIVCEGVLGLSLLILLIRFKGLDKLNSINLMLW
uniref:NADH-ubiquinone oxidoreductase chain 4L n=1 Tax=Ibalia leucospoides TaxID=32408 RepID=A0A0E3DQR6_9HYME|nr:NADH dehydrogenase subunit 4L [Ibalia leucospoides]AIK21710.1 NADH dehydrogenase subunit 4L [Ibalia leucospoides]